MTLGNLHLASIAAPQTNVLTQDQRLDEAHVLDRRVGFLKLLSSAFG